MREKALALPRASHSGEVALAGFSRLRPALLGASIFFPHAVVTVANIGRVITPSKYQ